MQTTRTQTELEQAQAILEEAQGALQDRCGSTDLQDASGELVRDQREDEIARRNASLADRERQLDAIRAQQDEAASELERRAEELRRQFDELEDRQTALLARYEAGQQQSQAEGPAEEIETAESQPDVVPGPPQIYAGPDRRRAVPAPGRPPADESAVAETVEETCEDRAEQPEARETDASEAAANESRETRPVARAARVQRASDEDQSIEQYMAALLNRMRGGSDADLVIAPQRKPVKQEEPPPLVPDAKPPAQPVEPVASSQRVVDVKMAPVEMERRLTTAAEVSDLAALRELANTHARTAIDAHGKKQLLKASLGAWAAGIGTAAGSLFAYCVLPADEFVLRTGCMTAFMASSYWIFKAVAATQKLLASSPEKKVAARANTAKAAESEKAAE